MILLFYLKRDVGCFHMLAGAADDNRIGNDLDEKGERPGDGIGHEKPLQIMEEGDGEYEADPHDAQAANANHRIDHRDKG